jgi:DNA polymerase epsilon subunit 3
LTLFLFDLSEFRKKNAGKKAAVPKGKGDEKGKKRKAEGEPSDKGDGGDDDQ